MGFAQIISDQTSSKSFIDVNQIVGDKHSVINLIQVDATYNAIQVNADVVDQFAAGGHIELFSGIPKFDKVWTISSAVAGPAGTTNLLVPGALLNITEDTAINNGFLVIRQIWLGMAVGYDKMNQVYAKYDVSNSNHEFVGLVTKIININRFEITLSGEYLDKIEGYGLDADSTYYADPAVPGSLVKEISNLKVIVTKGSSGFIKGFEQLSDINQKLDLLIPNQPAGLNQKAITITGLYTAKETATGDVKSNVISDSTPEIILSPFEDSNGFKEEIGAELQGIVNDTILGKKLLTDQLDTGEFDAAGNATVSGDRISMEDFDFYAGQSGKAGFWIALKVKIITVTILANKLNTAKLKMGNLETPVFSFNVDDAGLPVISAFAIEAVVFATTQKKISGVPVLSQNDQIQISATVQNAIKRFYRNGNILVASSGQTNSQGAAKTGSGIEGEDFVISAGNGNLIAVTVSANRFSADWQATLTAYNSRSQTATGAVKVTGQQIRIDSLSNEAVRLEAGAGQYPAAGYGGAYNSDTDLAGTEALMMQNGKYQYPAGNFATLYLVAGPDYSALAGLDIGGTQFRWAIFSLGAITNQNSITFTIAGAENFSSIIEADMKLYVKVEGATGWLDANVAYSAGDPVADGDAALDFGASSATFKRVTLGATVRTGTVYVRIGIASSSNKKFSSIS